MANEKEIINCTLCDGTFVRAFDDGEFSVERCDLCGFGVTVPFPKDLSSYYENYYGGRHGFTAEYRARRRLAKLKRHIATGSVLDIGYGEGTFLIEAEKSGFECSGVERFRNGNATFRTFDDISEVTGKFDAITMWHSLEHLVEPGKALERAFELLQDSGSVFIAVPNFGGRQARLFGRDWLHLDLPRHLYHFTNNSLRLLLKKRGFTLADVWHHESEYDIMGWSQSFLNRIFREKNVFFNTLTGKETNASSVTKAVHFVLGSIASVAAIPLVAIDIATKRGGTIVVRATKQSS